LRVGVSAKSGRFSMDAWVWIVIAVGAVVLLALLLVGLRRSRERRLQAKRDEARGLRQEAEARARLAEERSAVADELAQRADSARQEAQVASRRADEIDPDVD
jgi:FtsZ-interacting cell division protein ZipA